MELTGKIHNLLYFTLQNNLDRFSQEAFDGQSVSCIPSTRRRGPRAVVGWTRDLDDEPVAQDVQEVVEDDMQMMAELEVPHPSETTKVPHPSETETPTTTEVTPHTLLMRLLQMI